MNARRAESSATDQQMLAEWIRRGIVHPPLLSWAWPGASPAVKPWTMPVRELRAHIYLDHCQWHFGWKLAKLEKEHRWMHDDPLFSHCPMDRGEYPHVHEDSVSNDEGLEWEW